MLYYSKAQLFFGLEIKWFSFQTGGFLFKFYRNIDLCIVVAIFMHRWLCWLYFRGFQNVIRNEFPMFSLYSFIWW